MKNKEGVWHPLIFLLGMITGGMIHSTYIQVTDTSFQEKEEVASFIQHPQEYIKLPGEELSDPYTAYKRYSPPNTRHLPREYRK